MLAPALCRYAVVGLLGILLDANQSGAALQATAGPTFSGGVKAVPTEVMASHCLTVVSPEYPPSASGLGKVSVTVHVLIERSGNVVALYASSGPPVLRDAAMHSVRQWKYSPYLEQGVPRSVTTEVVVMFIPGQQMGLIMHPHQAAP